MNSKYDKINLIDIKEPYSKVIHLENRIRNSNAHYNVDFNILTQKITFKDKYKENIKTKELYLIQFVELCVENLYLVLYLNEKAYNLRKIQLLEKGILPSFKDDINNVVRNAKIGRIICTGSKIVFAFTANIFKN